MGSQDRFYQLEFKDRPVFKGDIGSLIKISGLIVSGGGAQAGLLLPSAGINVPVPYYVLTDEEWNDFIRRSDDPEILIEKIFQRKVRWEISGSVQQKIWTADRFMCRYCGAPMGKALMTIDHFDPLELGGKNDETNYLTACKKCNKEKANMCADDWCKKMAETPLRYMGAYTESYYRDYLKNRKLP
jgi:hypothetical protein